MKVQVLIASDHAGFDLKQELLSVFKEPYFDLEISFIDLGPNSETRVDYPDFADLVAQKINSGENAWGILVCGSGQGMAMRANKYPNVRAALCYNQDTVILAREHNDANILCLGARLLDHKLAPEMVASFLKTNFAGGRHQDRVLKLKAPLK